MKLTTHLHLPRMKLFKHSYNFTFSPPSIDILDEVFLQVKCTLQYVKKRNYLHNPESTTHDFTTLQSSSVLLFIDDSTIQVTSCSHCYNHLGRATTECCAQVNGTVSFIF
jgi:hypothetical protein